MSDFKSPGLTWILDPKLFILRITGASGISGVAVKCVDLTKNTNGEGSLLGYI